MVKFFHEKHYHFNASLQQDLQSALSTQTTLNLWKTVFYILPRLLPLTNSKITKLTLLISHQS